MRPAPPATRCCASRSEPMPSNAQNSVLNADGVGADKKDMPSQARMLSAWLRQQAETAGDRSDRARARWARRRHPVRDRRHLRGCLPAASWLDRHPAGLALRDRRRFGRLGRWCRFSSSTGRGSASFSRHVSTVAALVGIAVRDGLHRRHRARPPGSICSGSALFGCYFYARPVAMFFVAACIFTQALPLIYDAHAVTRRLPLATDRRERRLRDGRRLRLDGQAHGRSACGCVRRRSRRSRVRCNGPRAQ